MILYCLEGGVFLVLAPWTSVWSENVFFQLNRGIMRIFLNAFFKGAISGLGLILFVLGVVEFFTFARLVVGRGTGTGSGAGRS